MKKLLLVILFLISLSANAKTDTIRLVVPFAQGGNADQLARLIQKTLVQDLHKIVVVEYRPGASTEIGTMVVANSNPSDLVLLLNGAAIITSNLNKNKLSYIESNIIPLVHMGYVPHVLLVSKKSGIKTFKDLQNISPNSPITYGSSGILTGTHLSGINLQQQLGKNFIHVPYKGVGQAIPDLISGNLDMLIIHWSAAEQFIKSDQVTALAIESDNRIPQLPNVPSFKELNVPHPGRHGYLMLFSNVNNNKDLQNQVIQSVLKMINSPAPNPYLELGFIKEKNPLLVSDYFKIEKSRYSKLLDGVNIN